MPELQQAEPSGSHLAAKLVASVVIMTGTTVAGLLVLIQSTGGDTREVWRSFLATLAPQLGMVLAMAAVGLVAVMVGFVLGWVAVRLFGVLAVEALRIVTKPLTDTIAAVQGAGGAVVRAGGGIVQGARDGVMAAGGKVADAGRAAGGVLADAANGMVQRFAPGGGATAAPGEAEKKA